MSTLATTFLVNNPLEQFEINDFVFISVLSSTRFFVVADVDSGAVAELGNLRLHESHQKR